MSIAGIGANLGGPATGGSEGGNMTTAGPSVGAGASVALFSTTANLEVAWARQHTAAMMSAATFRRIPSIVVTHYHLCWHVETGPSAYSTTNNYCYVYCNLANALS